MDKLKFLSGIDGIERKNLFSLIFDRIKKSEFSDSVSFTQSGTEFKNVPIGIVNHPISSKGAYHMLVGKEYI